MCPFGYGILTVTESKTSRPHDGPGLSIAANTYAFRMLALGWVGEAVYALVQAEVSDRASLFTAGKIFMLLWWSGAAAFFFGAIAGILFGIPKSVENDSERPNRGIWRRYRANANIEEISDWLTKIIVGLTLVNIRQIVEFLGDLTRNIGTAIASTSNPSNAGAQSGQIVAFAVIVYGFSCGFLYFYFWARDIQFDRRSHDPEPPDRVSGDE